LPQDLRIDTSPDLDHRARKLMSKDHRRIVAKRIMKNMEISSANPAIGDFQLYLIFPALRLFDVQDIDISVAGCKLYKRFHYCFLGFPKTPGVQKNALWTIAR
jgi:hypothetical protein